MVPILLGGAAVYGLAVGALYVFQDQLIFPRGAAGDPVYRLPAHTERLVLRTEDEQRIVGYLIRALGNGRGLVLGFTGNAWNAADCAVFLAQRLPDYDVAVFHYRGYPPSEGEPGEAALFADAELVHDTLVRGLSPERVHLVGFSLGSGVAAYLAGVRPVDGAVLVTPFDSIEAVARQRYPLVPVRWLLRHPFRSDRHLAERDVPVAVLVARDDRVVPRQRSEALVRALRRPVLYEVLPGTHSGIYDLPEIDRALRRALAAIERAQMPMEAGDTVTLTFD